MNRIVRLVDEKVFAGKLGSVDISRECRDLSVIAFLAVETHYIKVQYLSSFWVKLISHTTTPFYAWQGRSTDIQKINKSVEKLDATLPNSPKFTYRPLLQTLVLTLQSTSIEDFPPQERTLESPLCLSNTFRYAKSVMHEPAAYCTTIINQSRDFDTSCDNVIDF